MELLREKMDQLVEREKRFEDIKEQVKTSPDGQVSLTHPDAKAVILHRNIVHVGYNIQTSTDSKNKMIIDQFCGGITDLNDLGIAVKRAQTALLKKHFDVLADDMNKEGLKMSNNIIK